MTEQRISCPDCGTRLEEWDPEQGGDRFAYYAKAYKCPGCRAIHTAYDAEIENAKTHKNDHPYMPYLKVRLEPRDEVKAEQYRRRFYGGYKSKPQSESRKSKTDLSRKLKTAATEGQPQRDLPTIDQALSDLSSADKRNP